MGSMMCAAVVPTESLKGPGTLVEWTLREKKALTHNTYFFRFALDDPTYVSGVKAGMHLMITAPNRKGHTEGAWNGKEDETYGKDTISRPYTPVSVQDAPGYVDLVIKTYRPDETAGFPDGGKCSKFLEGLEVGHKAAFSGPIGYTEYLGGGVFKKMTEGAPRDAMKRFSMVAGGTGLTPLFALAQKMLNSEKADERDIEIRFLFANRAENDIMFKEQLDGMAKKFPKRFAVEYTLTDPPAGWMHQTGRVDEAMFKKVLFPASSTTTCLVCGPGPFYGAVGDAATAVGYLVTHIVNI